MKKTFFSIFILSFSLAPLSVLASGTNTIKSFAGMLVNLLNTGSLMLISASVMVYMGVAVSQIWDVSRGKAKKGEATTRLIWGIIIIFFMVSIWGVVEVLEYTFLGGPGPQNTSGVINYKS